MGRCCTRALRPDFTTLLAEAENLLSRIDGIVDFSRAESAEPDREQIETIQITPDSTIIALERAETLERPAKFDGRSEENEIGPISPE